MKFGGAGETGDGNNSGLYAMNLKLYEPNCINYTLNSYGAVFDISEK